MENEKLKDCILESRVFSNGIKSDSLLSTKMQATLNINSMITYLESDLAMQLKAMILATNKYSKTIKDDPEKYDSLTKYFTSELARLITQAKSQMGDGNGSLVNLLRLSSYGSEVTKVGKNLSRYLNLATQAQNKNGVVPSTIQLKLPELFKELIDLLKSKYLTNNEELELDENEAKIITQSDFNTISTDLLLDKRVDSSIYNLLNSYNINNYSITILENSTLIKFKETITNEQLNWIKLKIN